MQSEPLIHCSRERLQERRPVMPLIRLIRLSWQFAGRTVLASGLHFAVRRENNG
jgi:hypothetical protein